MELLSSASGMFAASSDARPFSHVANRVAYLFYLIDAFEAVEKNYHASEARIV